MLPNKEDGHILFKMIFLKCRGVYIIAVACLIVAVRIVYINVYMKQKDLQHHHSAVNHSANTNVAYVNKTTAPVIRNRVKFTTKYNEPLGPKDKFPCVTLYAAKYPPICIYTRQEDHHISSSLADSGTWEGAYVQRMLNWLSHNKDLGFIDVGANIGVYTLAAASFGRQVVAVEPSLPNIRRLQKSLHNGKLLSKVTLLRNAVSSKRGKVGLTVNMINRGNTVIDHHKHNTKCNVTVNCDNPDADAILMDDLLEVIPFTKAIMKIDVEGYEMHAFTHAEKLFSEVQLPVIMMEWLWFAENNEEPWEVQVNKSIPYKTEVRRFIDYFLKKGYKPYSSALQHLIFRRWETQWGLYIFWVHRETRLH